MTPAKLSALVAEAVSLDREISDLTDTLKVLKSQLAAEAATRSDEATATDGGGQSIVFEGGDGCVARVTTSGDALKSSIKGEGKDIEKIRAVAGRAFGGLFVQAPSYKLVDGFREQAVTLLGGRDAARLLKLCTNPGKTTVSFETKDTAEG